MSDLYSLDPRSVEPIREDPALRGTQDRATGLGNSKTKANYESI